ncbi:MAG: ABC transporter permease [Lachnospiraceae bacterium]
MKKYLIKRITTLLPVLFIVSLVIFTLIHLTPGDPARIMLGAQASEADVNALRESMGLTDALPTQYIRWLGDIFRGDFGDSIFINQPMSQILAEHMAPTFTLTIYALFFSLLLAIPLGILAAVKRGTMTDNVIEGLSMCGISIPSFLLGLFLILIFTVKLGWLPVAGYKPIREYGFLNNLRYMILPAMALGFMESGLIIRMTRSSVLEVLNCDYIKMAKAKGVKSKTLIFRHALKNAMLPILTTVGQSLMGLLSGASIVETVFNIPGLGQLIINSVSRRDYEVIQAVVLFVSLINVLVCFLIDMLYGAVDPRVRLED